MIITKVLLVIIIYIFIAIIIGKVNFRENIKRNFMLILSSIYNFFWGYIDTYFILILYGYFVNRPKGSGYEVPESETGFNIMLGIITLILYLILLIPINIYMKKKGKSTLKVYSIINITSTILGILIFWIFLDKNTKLF